MTIAAALSALGFLAAALFATLGPRFTIPARVLALLSALLLLPGIDAPSRWPFLALAAGAAALATPLPCVLASAGSTLALLRPETNGVAIAPVVLSLAAASAAGAVSSTLRSRQEDRPDTTGVVAVAGAALVALLSRLDGGGVLRWAFGLGGGTSRLELPGAGLLLGLTLLTGLAGTLLLAAHRVAPAVAGARRLGTCLLLPGAALGLLAAAHITLQGLRQGREALAAGAAGIAALVVLAGTLASLLGHALAEDEPSSPDLWAERETAMALALTWLAVAVAGWECWRSEGTYLCRNAATVAAAGLLGLGAVVPTILPGTRRLVVLVFLATAVLFPGALSWGARAPDLGSGEISAPPPAS